jgi:hypothetical protein
MKPLLTVEKLTTALTYAIETAGLTLSIKMYKFPLWVYDDLKV